MRQLVQRRTAAAALVLAGLCISAMAPAQKPSAAKEPLKRGQYLVEYGGCADCHTPKILSPNGPTPDPARTLAGHPADAQLPPVPTDALGPGKWAAVTNDHLTAWGGPWGVSFAANLTPDKRTGLGNWTVEQFIKTMRTGKHFGTGHPILPPMPWYSLNVLTDQDLRAVFAYLRSLKPIDNPVPAPVPPK
jgi:mono/diheme cytochrome c family protein